MGGWLSTAHPLFLHIVNSEFDAARALIEHDSSLVLFESLGSEVSGCSAQWCAGRRVLALACTTSGTPGWLLELILQRGKDHEEKSWNHRDDWKLSALDCAVMRTNTLENVQRLLKWIARNDIRTEQDVSLLMEYVEKSFRCVGTKECYQLLCEYGEPLIEEMDMVEVEGCRFRLNELVMAKSLEDGNFYEGRVIAVPSPGTYSVRFFLSQGVQLLAEADLVRAPAPDPTIREAKRLLIRRRLRKPANCLLTCLAFYSVHRLVLKTFPKEILQIITKLIWETREDSAWEW